MNAPRTLSRTDHSVNARRFLTERYSTADNKLLLLHWHGRFYQWRDNTWDPMARADLEAVIYAYLEGARCALFQMEGGYGQYEPYAPNRARVGETLAALRAAVHVETGSLPTYLEDARPTRE